MSYIKLMRPKHYIKNFLVFLPLLFSGMFFDKNNILTCLLGFICFSLLASTIYIINDIKDKDKDKMHKTKFNRPIASGKVSVKNAIILDILLITIIVLICILGNFNALSISLALLYFIFQTNSINKNIDFLTKILKSKSNILILIVYFF